MIGSLIIKLTPERWVDKVPNHINEDVALGHNNALMNAFEAQAHAKMNFKRKGKAAADEAEGPYDVDENDDNY